MNILTTKNYSLFKLLKFNRPISEQKVKQMMKAYEDGLDLFSHFPIVVDRNMNIFDGQHRFEACKRLGIPIFYTQMQSGSTIDNVSAINNNQTRWSRVDFMNAFVKKGVEDYQILKDFYENSDGLPFSYCVLILGQRTHDDHGAFRHGKFKIASVKKAEQVMKALKDLAQIDKKKYFHRRIVEALIYLQKIEGFNFAQFISKCKEYDYKVRIQATFKEQIWSLDEVYNYRASKNRLNLFNPAEVSKIKD